MVRWVAEIEGFKVTLRQSISRVSRDTVKNDAGRAYAMPNGCNEHDSNQPGSPKEGTPTSLDKDKQGIPGECNGNIDGVVEELVPDNACGVEGIFDANERSTKSDEQIFELPSFDATESEPSPLIVALDIGFGLKIIQTPTHLDWLDLDRAHDWKEIVTAYFQISSHRIRAYLNEAIESVRSMKVPPTTCQDSAMETPALPANLHPSAMDIDLDAAFDGQGMLDLDEEDVSLQAGNESSEVTDKKQEVDSVFSYAKSLLESKRKGLPLSGFIPDESETNGFLQAALEHSGFPYDGRGARRAASEVAYHYFYKGVDTLRGQGSVAPRLAEADRSKDWLLLDSSGRTPFDAHTYEAGIRSHGIAMAHKSKRSQEKTRFDHFEHYNFLGNRVSLRSETPAAVSLYVQMSCRRKVARDPLSREGVILSQATKYIDPVAYDGPQEHLLVEGNACRDRVTGYAVKLNDPEGTFGDVFDGETAIISQGAICQFHLADQWQHDRMQHPYIMNAKEHAFSGRGDLIINAPEYCLPKDSSYRCDTAGRMILWNDGVTPKPAYIPSKLSRVEIIAYEADEVDTSGPVPSIGPLKIIHEMEEQEIMTDMTEQTDEEYSPFNPSIPEFTATHQEWLPEEWQLEGISDEEATRYVDELIARLTAAANGPPVPTCAEHSSYTAEPLGNIAFSTVDVPLSPVRFTSRATTDEQRDKITMKLLALEAQPMTRASSGSSADYKRTSEDEDFQSSGATTPDHAVPITGIELNPSPQPPEENNLSKDEITDNGGPHSEYATTYASFVFGFALAASFLW
ncbi:hypothetical protein Q9189_004093 [Teloschistes chrysophthalmus]